MVKSFFSVETHLGEDLLYPPLLFMLIFDITGGEGSGGRGLLTRQRRLVAVGVRQASTPVCGLLRGGVGVRCPPASSARKKGFA